MPINYKQLTPIGKIGIDAYKAIRRVEAERNLSFKVSKPWRIPRCVCYPVRLGKATQLKTALSIEDELAERARMQVVIAVRVAGILIYQFQLSNSDLWTSYRRSDLKFAPGLVGVGKDYYDRQVDFTFDPPHTGVFGTTNSGKTETLRSMLVGLLTAYRPHELKLLLIDHKGKFSEFANVAHLAMPVACYDNEIDDLLNYANTLVNQREQSREYDGTRFVVVVDEADYIFEPYERWKIGQALAKRGREVKINLIIAGQEPNKSNVSKFVSMVNNRWVGLVADAHVSHFLTGQSGLSCHKLSGKGDFVYTNGNNQTRLLVAKAEKEDFEKLPRSEPPKVEIIKTDPLETFDSKDNFYEFEGPKAGRPRTKIQPEVLAHFLFYNNVLSEAQTAEVFDLRHNTHYRYKSFTQRVLDTLEMLKGKDNG